MNRAIIDDKKVKAIYSYIETLRNGKQIKMMFDFSFLGLMRSVNFRNLQIKDVIDEYGNIKDIIVLDSEKNKGKNKAKYYVSDELKKSIKEYLKDEDITKGETYLFISPKTGKPYSRTYISTLFSNVFNVFGLDCSTHFGRRHGITKLLTEKHIDIATVQRIANHRHISTTSIYYNENPNLLKEVVNCLSK